MLDLLLRNVRAVRPGMSAGLVDIGIRDGKFEVIEPDIHIDSSLEVIDGMGRLAFPGVVDAHQHWGIYNPLEEDADSESRAAAQGGVTTGITYLRTVH